MAPLQKRALYSLIIGLLMTIALVVVLLVRGDINELDTDENLRLLLYTAVIGVPLVYLILVNITLRKPTQVDERDKTILDRAGKAQFWGAIFSLIVWTIALTEIHQSQGQIPFIYVSLILPTALIISTLSQSFGIILGYWSIPGHE